MKVQAARRILPPSGCGLSKVLDQYLTGPHDCRPTGEAELVLDIEPYQQGQADHVQPVFIVISLGASELYRSSSKVSKARRWAAQPPHPDVKPPSAFIIGGLGGHRQRPGLTPQREPVGGARGRAVDFLISASCVR